MKIFLREVDRHRGENSQGRQVLRDDLGRSHPTPSPQLTPGESGNRGGERPIPSHSHCIQLNFLLKNVHGASLVVQWLKACLPVHHLALLVCSVHALSTPFLKHSWCTILRSKCIKPARGIVCAGPRAESNGKLLSQAAVKPLLLDRYFVLC